MVGEHWPPLNKAWARDRLQGLNTNAQEFVDLYKAL